MQSADGMSKQDGRDGGGGIKHRAPSKHQYAGNTKQTCGDGYEECGARFQKTEKGRRWGKKIEEDWVMEAQLFFLSGVFAEESLWGFCFKLLLRSMWQFESQSSKSWWSLWIFSSEYAFFVLSGA